VLLCAPPPSSRKSSVIAAPANQSFIIHLQETFPFSEIAPENGDSDGWEIGGVMYGAPVDTKSLSCFLLSQCAALRNHTNVITRFPCEFSF
jgi:hypothetical protein